MAYTQTTLIYFFKKKLQEVKKIKPLTVSKRKESLLIV